MANKKILPPEAPQQRYLNALAEGLILIFKSNIYTTQHTPDTKAFCNEECKEKKPKEGM
jgi:hypothetical protein